MLTLNDPHDAYPNPNQPSRHLRKIVSQVGIGIFKIRTIDSQYNTLTTCAIVVCRILMLHDAYSVLIEIPWSYTPLWWV